MPTTLPPIATTTPWVDPRTGILTRTGVAWFQSSYLRQGGQDAQSNTELAGGVSDNSDHIGQVEEDLGQTQTSLASLDADVTVLQADVVHLRAEVTALQAAVTTLQSDVAALTLRVMTLETTVSDHETRLDALDAWKAAMQAALPALVAVTAVPTLANDPATAALLEDDLTANWQGTLQTNDSAVATTVNAVRNALAA